MKYTYDPKHKGLDILVTNTSGAEVRTLERIHEHFEDMTSKHSKVLALRLDLRVKRNSTIDITRQRMSHLHENLKVDLKRNTPLKKTSGAGENEPRCAHFVDPRVMTVIEQHDGSPHHHAHMLILVNGNAKRNRHDIVKRVERQLKNVFGDEADPSMINYCDKKGRNPIMLDRNSTDFQRDMNEAFRAASYLAKEKGKQSKEKGAWSFMCPRLLKKYFGK